jgi:hypothetical protein
LYSSPNIIRVIKSDEDVSRFRGDVGEVRNVYKILVRKFQGKRPLGRHKHGREDNINMYFRDIGCEDDDWVYIIQDGVQ